MYNFWNGGEFDVLHIYIYVWGKILLRRFVARNGTFEENLGISRSSSKFHATERYL
jgi:hypothetical protein